MAATDAGLDHIADQTHRMATDMARSEKSAEGLSDQFRQAALTFFGFDAIRRVIVEMVQRTTIFQSLQQAVSKENLSRTSLLKREIDLTSEKNLLERSVLTATGLEGDYQKARLAHITSELGILQLQKNVVAEMERIHHGTFAVLLIYKAALVDLYIKTGQFNQNLIEANSTFDHRNRLIKETLLTQTQLGTSFGEITKAAAALVHYGLDAESSFNDNLRLVVQMEHGLGVSVNASAQLASIVERQLKGSFTDVASVIAEIVNDTALAGDEAVRLATAISTAMGRLRPGLGAQGLPEVVRLVGRYEAALKEVGGVPGAFQQLLTGLTTTGGIVGAGALGVNPEFIATSKGVQDVMDRFAKYGDMLVGQSQGWERQFRLQMLADVFGTSADSANQMLMAIQRANQAQTAAISIQDRWREQMHATNSGISRLINSFMGLLQGGLLPIVNLIGFVTNKLADFVEWITRSRIVVGIVTTALGVGLVLTIGSLWNLVRALYAVTSASVAAAAAQARLAITGGAGAATGLSGLAGMLLRPLLLVARGIGLLLTPLGLLAMAAVGAGVVLKMIYDVNKQSRDDQLASQKIQIAMADRLGAQTRARLYAAARSERPEEEILKVYKSLASQARFHGKTLEEQKAWLDQQGLEVPLELLRGATTAGMFTPLTERTPEQARREDAMQNISEKLLKVNEDQKTLLDKSQRQQADNARALEVEDAKNRCILWRGKYNPLQYLRVASDYYSEKMGP